MTSSHLSQIQVPPKLLEFILYTVRNCYILVMSFWVSRFPEYNLCVSTVSRPGIGLTPSGVRVLLHRGSQFTTFFIPKHIFTSPRSLVSIQPWWRKEPVLHLRWTVVVQKNNKTDPMLNSGSRNLQANKVVSHIQQFARQVCLNAAARFPRIPKFRDFQFHRSSLLVRASVLFRIRALWSMVLAKAA